MCDLPFQRVWLDLLHILVFFSSTQLLVNGIISFFFVNEYNSIVYLNTQ